MKIAVIVIKTAKRALFPKERDYAGRRLFWGCGLSGIGCPIFFGK
jgi:hypothetical protein